ncbi:MAG TPA: DUF47 family protein [Nitrososphaerales archaeon]|nr:DUF47 family protein [Nitrososphaerales archaeon]
MKIRFLVAGEKGVFERLKALADKAREETPLAIKLFQERLADSSVLEGMKALEKQSDELTFKLSEDIMNGAINPAVLRDLLHVSDLMDSVFDDYYFLAREVNRTVKSGIELPMQDRMTATFVAQVNLADKQIETLGRLLEANGMDEVRSYRNEIEKLEESGDELKDSGFDDMYDNRKLFDYFSFQHYTEVLRKLDDIQDGVEDMSDLILAIANTISR